MTIPAQGQEWLKPAELAAALNLSRETLRRLRHQGRLIAGRDYLQVTPSCLRYNLPAVRQALSTEVR